MKKTLLTLLLGVSTLSMAQSWVDVDNSISLLDDPNYQEVITTADNQRYCVYTISGNGNEGHILKYDEYSKSWVQPSNELFASDISDVSLATIGNKLYIGYIDNWNEGQYIIQEFDGDNFTQIGGFWPDWNQVTLQLTANSTDLFYCESFNSDFRIISVSKYDGIPESWSSELYSEGDVNNIISGNKDQFLATDSDLWILGGDGNDPAPDSLKLFRSTLGSGTLTTHSALEADAYNYSISGVNNALPYIGYLHNDGVTKFAFHQVTGVGTSLLADDAAANFNNISLSNNSNNIYLTGLQSLTTEEMVVLEWNGTSFVPHANGSLAVSSGSEYLTKPSLFTNENGRLFGSVTVVFGGAKSGSTGLQIKMTNDAPIATTHSVTDQCENGWDVVFSDDFTVTDADMDSTYIFVDGNTDNSGVLDAANITFESPAYNPLSVTRTFKIKAQYFGGAGTVNIPIGVTDGYDTIYTSVQLEVFGLPQINYQLTGPLELCENGEAYDLNQTVLPLGGVFSGEGVDGHYFDPQFDFELPGEYSIDYTYTDGNGCSNTFNMIPTILSVDVLDVISTNSSCTGTDGTASVSVIGQNAPYDYYWSTGSTGTTVSNLAPGVYYINVTDVNNCLLVEQVNIQSTNIVLTENISSPSCHGDNDGAIDLTPIGAGPFQFLWSTGDSTEDVSGLVAGNYFVTITDASGCISTANYEVTQPAKLKFTTSTYESSCSGADGNASTWDHAGGTGNYTHWWSSGETGTEIMYAAPGTYQYVLKDDSGCVSDTAHMTVGTWDGPFLSATVTNSGCNMSDGSIDLTIQQNTNPVASITWSNMANTEDISGLSPGTYSVEVEDDQGCKSFLTRTIGNIKPLQNDICVVTVDTATTTNLVVWEKEQLVGIDHYNIYREGPVAGDYIKIAEKDADTYSQYTDLSASPQVRSWRYKISAVNECGIEGPLSPRHKTIHVVYTETGGVYNISWDKYEGFDYPTFYLERRDAVNTNWVPVNDGPSASYFTEVDTPPTAAGLDYRVSVDAPSTCTSQKANDYNSSRSNRSAGIFAPGDTDVTSLTEEEMSYDLKVYPNPATNSFTIVVEGTMIKSITIKTLNGQIIANDNINAYWTTKNIENIAAGVYLVEVDTEDGKSVHKLIKQ